MPKIIILWTDIVFFGFLLSVGIYLIYIQQRPQLLISWKKVMRRPQAMVAMTVLILFTAVATLDSMHYRDRLPEIATLSGKQEVAYSPVVKSLLDHLLSPLIEQRERTYSHPLAIRQWTKESRLDDGELVRDFPRLRFGGAHLADPVTDYGPDVVQRVFRGILVGSFAATVLTVFITLVVAHHHDLPLGQAHSTIWRGQTPVAWRALMMSVWGWSLLIGIIAFLAQGYHVLGTDATGNDVLYQSLKSIRTALVIGMLTTVATLPFALSFGILAGYFKSWVDDVIQYVYTTISSVPSVLLIAACVLMMQVYIDNNPDLFPTSAQRADIRLFLLCLILGVTGWAGLCRLLRAETLKLRELDYIQAARAFGVSHWRIMKQHILPNVMHLVLITLVLDFSSIVLLEAVLSYIGVGVDPQMFSFGSMINLARTEVGRSPMIWWNIFAAFSFMWTLVLAANLFADAVRDAFDPRAKRVRPAWLRRPYLTQEQS